MEEVIVGAVISWSLQALTDVVSKFVQRCRLVKANRRYALRLAARVAGIVVALPDRLGGGVRDEELLNNFFHKILPSVQALIDKCCDSGVRLLNIEDAASLHKALKDGEKRVEKLEKELSISLPSACWEATKISSEPDATHFSQAMHTLLDTPMSISGENLIDRIRGVSRKVLRLKKTPSPQITGVDLVFLCDASGTIGSLFDEVKKKIRGAVTKAKQTTASQNFLLNVGMVIYRDFWDESKHIEKIDLSRDTHNFMSCLDSVVAGGGMDIAEDVLGGLAEVQNMNWCNSNSTKKILMHFADSPCHGSDFHNLEPEDDAFYDMKECNKKYGRRTADKLLKGLMEMNVIYLFVRINHTTDKMVEKFQKLSKSPNPLGFPRQVELNKAVQTLDNVISEVVNQPSNHHMEPTVFELDKEVEPVTEQYEPKSNINKTKLREQLNLLTLD